MSRALVPSSACSLPIADLKSCSNLIWSCVVRNVSRTTRQHYFSGGRPFGIRADVPVAVEVFLLWVAGVLTVRGGADCCC